MLEYENIKLHWLGHDSFLIEAKGKNIYIDPFKISKSSIPIADVIITTHEHFDHCNPDQISQISNKDTILIGPDSTQDLLKEKVLMKKEVRILNVGDSIEVDGIKITAIPAYNIHRFREPGIPFHPVDNGHIGPILDIDGTTIYHSGDTDLIPEMKGLKPDIALIPVSGTYVMDVDEAMAAARDIGAKITVPMHVGRGIGEISYTLQFKDLLTEMRVEVLELEE